MDWGIITWGFGAGCAVALIVNACTLRRCQFAGNSFWMAGLLTAMWLGNAWWVSELSFPESLHLGPPLDVVGGLAAGLIWRNSRERWAFWLLVAFLVSSAAHVVFFALPHPGRSAAWVYQFGLNVLSAVQLLIVMFPGIRHGLLDRRRQFRRSSDRFYRPGAAAARRQSLRRRQA